MKPELLVAYLDGELSAEEEQQIEAELERNVQFQRILSELCYQRLDYVEAFRDKVISPATISTTLPNLRQKSRFSLGKQPRRASPSPSFWGALAASVVLFLGLWMYTSVQYKQQVIPSSQIVSQIIKTGPNVQLVHLDKKITVATPVEVHEHDRILVPRGSFALIQYKDGSLIKLRDQTVLQMEEKNGAKHVFLATGKVSARISRQSNDKMMTVTTPQGEVKVLGTEFDLTSSTRKGTYLHLLKGKVSFQNYADNSVIQLTDSEWALIAPNTPFIPRLGSSNRYKDGKVIFDVKQPKWITDNTRVETSADAKGIPCMKVTLKSEKEGTVRLKVPSLFDTPSKAYALEFEVYADEQANIHPGLVMDPPKNKTDTADKRFTKDFNQSATSRLQKWNRWRYEVDYTTQEGFSEWFHIRLFAGGKLTLDEWGEGDIDKFQILLKYGSFLVKNVRVIERVEDPFESE